MSLQGSLKHLHLADVIQLISVSGKTGKFHLKRDLHLGEIFLKDGNIVHATLDDISGEEAVYELAIWKDGEFHFEPDIEPGVKTISKSNTNLLMEAARRQDEWRVLEKKIPSLDLIPEFVLDQGEERQIQLNTSEWVILSKINGKQDVRTIAKTCNLSIFDVSKLLYGLVTHGLITLKQPPPPAAPATEAVAPAPAASAQKAQTGEKDRLLALLEKIKNISNATLGKQGETLVDKQYQKALQDIEHGAGMGAIEEAVRQIAKASSILKGTSTTEMLLGQFKTLKL
jgi:hypothetical protein